ncbi:hypothetical protein HAHE_40880 [Haloferula helveola]|uniref:Methyltransferase domain-containing protein n=1 Tax=Haloferula helveola TaxID=490095 RepID=A0ABM7RQ11_9BACT|nr:hypothetical protein HAHE_40880 [Haloferula helveola]
MKRALILPILLLIAIVALLAWQPWSAPGETPDAADSPGAQVEPSVSVTEPAPAPLPDPPAYETGETTSGGTGKYYMGREIAQVMGHRGISWLERDNREEEEAPSKAIRGLDLAENAVLADIGAGSGYYTFRIAPLVPKGSVIAVDIQPEMIAHLEKRAKANGVNNVRTQLGTIEDTKLETNSIDAALMVDAYHEFSHPVEMLQSIVRALRPGGRVILLEYRAEDPDVPIKRLHKMSEEQVRKEMAAVGLEFVVNHGHLPWQHFLIFRKPG